MEIGMCYYNTPTTVGLQRSLIHKHGQAKETATHGVCQSGPQSYCMLYCLETLNSLLHVQHQL